ncbi:hypothetical protein ACRAWG_12600 [Methylobacterium sp. P31]
MISRILQHDDFLWALDHSRRRYRVRPTRLGDQFGNPKPAYPGLVTVVSMNGIHRVVMAERCGLFPDEWEDTDRYASARLNAISMGRRARQRGGIR